MAAAFNLTAQINLQGPSNIKSIVSNIQKQVNGTKIKLNLDIGAASAKNITSITTRLNSLSKAAINANTNVATLSSTLSSLSKSFNTASSSANNNANSVAQTSKAVASAGKSLQQTRTAVEEFGKQAGLAVKRFAAFSAVTAPIYALTNAITSAFKEFVNFNKEIVRLSQVTGQSVSELSSVTKEITRLSTTLGVASSDLLTVATTLAQAGLSAEDTKIALEALAKSALAPSFESLTDTTEGAIAAIRQFGLQTKELDGALGSINAVAAAFAVEAGDIITAIQRTGGVFSSASRGVSEGSDALNEFIAIFTSVRATTRESAETIATGLRTIFTRIQRTKTIEQLREFGIELQDTEGKFVGLFEATKRLSEGLSRIDPRTAEFATISEELGGFRQIGKVIPLIQQFAVAEKALSVAQRGATSTSQDALVAQQSLAVQFTKTRENFLALVREIGESTSFKAFVGVSLTLANAFINLSRALKPLLPLLLTFASIKAGSAIREFGGGFAGIFGGGKGGGGAPPTGGIGTGTGGPGGKGGGGAATTAIIGNTNILNTVSQTLNKLNLSILALNQNIVNTNSLLLNRPAKGFATGGLVPGSGNGDTFRANLTPGEFVIRKRAVQSIGAENLAAMNRGGYIQKFINGGQVEDKINFIKGGTNKFGVVGLKSGTGTGFGESQTKPIDLGGKYGNIELQIASLSQEQGDIFANSIEGAIEQSFISSVSGIANKINKQLKIPGNPIDTGNLSSILKGSGLSNVVGAALESSIALTGAEYWDKTETTKSIDFPFGLGPAAGLFGANFPGNIPTDVTKTIGGVGKSETQIKEQIKRFIDAVYGEEFTKAIQLRESTTGAAILSPRLSKTLDTVKNKLGGGGSKAFSSSASYQEFINKWGTQPLKLASTEKFLRKLPTEQQPTFLTDYRKLVSESLKTKRVKRATGGDISGEDTVPALLTPGEFVFNKDAAQRIGYGTLNKLNKVKGYNKGGVVGYANGGLIGDGGNVAIGVAAISSIIIPEIEKLASSFSTLQGETAAYSSALSGATREASSLALSTGIALKAIGASKQLTGFAVGGAAIAGAISGGLTEGTGKALERALVKNTELFGKFDKTLQDLTQAPTEELRLEAAKRLEQTFNKLDRSVINATNNINFLENAQKAGESINNLTLSFITGLTAFNALKNSLGPAIESAKLAASSAGFSSMSGTMGVKAANIGILTKVLGTFGKFIPYLSFAITGFSLLSEGIKLFTGSLTKSSEQFDRLYKNLDETTKNSQAFSVANQNFIKNILPQFTKLRERGLSGAKITRELGTIGNLKDINELNFTFRTLLRSRLVSEGIPFSDMETMKELVNRMGSDQQKFNTIFDQTTKEFIQRQFVRSQTELGGMSTTEAEARFKALGGADSEAVKRIVEDYVGAKNREIAALRELTLANNQFKLSLVTLDNILISLSSNIEVSISKTLDQFDDLDRRLSIIGGEPRPQGGEILRRQINTLNNIRGASEADIKTVTTSVSNLLKIGETSPDQQKLFSELRSQVEASRVLQQELPVILREVQSQPGGRAGEQLSDTLRSKLEPTIQAITKDTALTNTIFKNLTDTVNANIQSGKESINSAQELAQNDKAIADLLQTSEKAIKAYNDVLEAGAKLQDKLAEQTKRRVDLENQLIQVSTQRLQLEAQEANELNRLLGVTTSLADLNKTFDISIKQLTSGIGIIPKGGTTDVGLISKQLALTKANVEAKDKELKANASNLTLQEQIRPIYDEEISRLTRLNKALNEIATSGEKTKNALDKIAEAQDQFKSRRQLLIDLLRGARNPETALQQKLVIDSIRAARSGRFRDPRQADLFLDQGVKILEAARIPAAEIERLISLAAGRAGLAQGIVPRTPEDVAALAKLDEFLASQGFTIGDKIATALPTIFAPFLSKIFPGSKVAELKTAQQERKMASDVVTSQITEQIKISTDGTAEIFKNFNIELAGIFASTIGNLQRIEQQTRENAIIAPTNNLGLSKKLTEKFSQLILGPKPTVNRAGNFGFGGMVSYSFGPEILTNEQKSIFKAQFGESQNLQDQIIALEEIRKQIMIEQDTARKTFSGAIGSPLDKARSAAIREIDSMLRAEKPKLEDLKRTQGRGPINDGASLQKFENSANQLSKSLSEAPLQNLSESLGLFSTTATQLVSALKDFTNKFQDGMKGEISYTGDIGINFNEELAVNIPKNINNTNNLISDLDRRLQPTIKRSVENVVNAAMS